MATIELTGGYLLLDSRRIGRVRDAAVRGGGLTADRRQPVKTSEVTVTADGWAARTLRVDLDVLEPVSGGMERYDLLAALDAAARAPAGGDQVAQQHTVSGDLPRAVRLSQATMDVESARDTAGRDCLAVTLALRETEPSKGGEQKQAAASTAAVTAAQFSDQVTAGATELADRLTGAIDAYDTGVTQ